MQRFTLTAKENVRTTQRIRPVGRCQAHEMITSSPSFNCEVWKRTKDFEGTPEETDLKIEETYDEVFDEIWERLEAGQKVDVGDFILEKEEEEET